MVILPYLKGGLLNEWVGGLVSLKKAACNITGRLYCDPSLTGLNRERRATATSGGGVGIANHEL